jgi:hypothetical protein
VNRVFELDQKPPRYIVMQCPIYEEIGRIRGSGLYPGDLSDDSAVTLGSGEVHVMEFARTQAMLTRLEHSRFLASGATPEEASKWWGLRYGKYAGRRLSDISNELTPEDCTARAVIGELVRLTQEIRDAIVRVIASRSSQGVTIPSDILENAPRDCSIRELRRSLKSAVRFATGLRVHGRPGLSAAESEEVRQILANCPREDAESHWSADSTFPMLGDDPKESCCRAATTLLRLYEHAITIESQGLELARAGALISRTYTQIISQLQT